MAPITLTLTATDPAHAQRILAAVARLDAPEAPPQALSPTGDPPVGHTYRELCEARRAGLLEAVMTRKGLVFTQEALDAYRALRADRRRRGRLPAEPAQPHRLRALHAAGIRPRVSGG